MVFREPFNNFEIIGRCAYSTKERDWKVFGIQFWGECWSSEDAIKTYRRAGKSGNCYQGVGSNQANFVYQFYEP